MLEHKEQLMDPKLYSPLTLAFVGDGVYELLVREKLVAGGSMPPGKLHSMAVKKVRCSAQSAVYQFLLGKLAPEEEDIMRRGRNATSGHLPKNADPIDYRQATGVEALFGYLYLKGQTERIYELFALIEGMINEVSS